MVNVFLTVDTELSLPLTSDWKKNQLSFEIDRDIYGRTPDGDFGIGFQIDRLNDHGLKGVFFVEGLVASAAGKKPLETIVDLVLKGGHEVQLHLHTHWLGLMESSPVGGRTGRHLRHFSREDQATLLKLAASNLEACGAPWPRAFRAGSFGANFDTLRALRDIGVAFDSSLNESAFGRSCDLRTPEPLTQPALLEGVVEFPVTVFGAAGGAARPFQICACSSGEMEEALESAWRNQWRAVTIVSHGFELVKRPQVAGKLAGRSRIRTGRFEALCRYLAANRDRFRTRGFADWPAEQPAEEVEPVAPLRVAPHRSAWRMVEQAADRFL